MLHMSILYTVLIPESANILHGSESYWTHFESKKRLELDASSENNSVNAFILVPYPFETLALPKFIYHHLI